MKNKRRTTISSLNAKTALETIKEQLTLSELAQKHQVHLHLMALWKQGLSRKCRTGVVPPLQVKYN